MGLLCRLFSFPLRYPIANPIKKDRTAAIRVSGILFTSSDFLKLCPCHALDFSTVIDLHGES